MLPPDNIDVETTTEADAIPAPAPAKQRNGKHEEKPKTRREEAIDDDLSRIDDIIFELKGSGFYFDLYRKRSYDTGHSMVGRINADEFDMEMIRNLYGGGNYRASAKDDKGRYFRRFEFAIAEEYEGKLTKKQDSGGDAVMLAKTVAELVKGSAPQKDGNEMMVAMMERQAQQGQQFMQLMMQMQSESTKAMMGLMGAMMTRPEPKSDGDFSTAITPILVKMIEQSNKPAPASGIDIKGLIELRDFLSPEREEKEEKGIIDSLIAAAPAFLPLLVPALGVMMGQKPAMQPQGFQELPTGEQPMPPSSAGIGAVTPSAPAPVGPPPVPAASAPPKLELMPMLKRGAAQDTDPESYAIVVADMVGDDGFEKLVEVLGHDEWKKLFQGFSEDEMVWVEEWREAVMELASDEDDEDDEEGEASDPVGSEALDEDEDEGEDAAPEKPEAKKPKKP